jgi:hypothetical protein
MLELNRAMKTSGCIRVAINLSNVNKAAYIAVLCDETAGTMSKIMGS